MDILEILKRNKALLDNDHFVGTSGRHIDTYINKDALYTHAEETSLVGQMMAEKVKDLDVDIVVGPAMGGIILAQWTAYHLSKLKGKEVLAVYTEKDKDGVQHFTRGYEKLIRGKNVLVVEDVLTTGGSAKKVVEVIQSTGGKVVAVSVMVNKNKKEIKSDFFRVQFFPLAEVDINTYEAPDCAMCKTNVPVNLVYGHGRKFLESLKK